MLPSLLAFAFATLPADPTLLPQVQAGSTDSVSRVPS